MWRLLQRLSKNSGVVEGGRVRVDNFNLPFNQNFNQLTAMFELRKWFVFNTPHKYYAEKYTNEMAHLHNELNYQQTRIMAWRGAIVFAAIYGYFWFVYEPEAMDWKDTFDLKFTERSYGAIAGSAGEGGSSMDD